MLPRLSIRFVAMLMSASAFSAFTASALTVDFNFKFISSSTTFTNGGNGGEYTLANLNGLSNSAYSSDTSDLSYGSWDDSLQTFCLEKSQHVRGGRTYGGILAEGAVPGTPGGTLNIDYLSIGTAYLYSQFAQGILTDYRFTGTASERKADAYRLQRIIWSLEGESVGDVTGDAWYAEAAGYASDKGGVTADAFGTVALGVQVINNVDVSTIGATVDLSNQRHQDFLYYAGTARIPPPQVPDGGSSLILLAAGLCGMAGAKRFVLRKEGVIRPGLRGML